MLYGRARESLSWLSPTIPGCEIDPGQDFDDEPEQDEQYPGKSDRGSEQRQRRLDQGHAIAQLQHHRPSQRQKRQSPRCQTKLAEKLQGFC
jgi:hypothetical protein